MDDLDTVGKYGTISLIRKNTLEPITSYPVDDERTTFGRDPKCSIRMYFHAIDPLHCALNFEDGKAYLEVHGTGGVTVDDALIPSGATVALNNASRFMIWRKLFLFNYPPREIRSQLMASPRKANSKSLRMSMIHSAVIMTPRADTRHQTLDLRTLQSPIKPYMDAPNEVVTFVDSDQIAVVEDRETGSPADGFMDVDDDQDRALVALEEIDYDENQVDDPAFSRSPVKRAPAGLFVSQQNPSTPFRALTPSLQRRPSISTIVPPLSSIKSPVPTYLPPSATPSAPRLLSPGRPLQSSSLVPRDQWRQAVASGFGPEPPRTPRRRPARMSMHKAVLVRSAHRTMMAVAKEREEKDEEDEVEEVVSPERPTPAANFSPIGEEAGDDDAEGEEDPECRESNDEGSHTQSAKRPVPRPASGVLRAGVNLFSSLSTYVRKSLSPERKTSSEAQIANKLDQDSEEGEILEEASAAEPPSPQIQIPSLNFQFGSSKPSSTAGWAKSSLTQESPVRPALQFSFSPLLSSTTTPQLPQGIECSPVKTAEEDITDAQDAKPSGEPSNFVVRHESNPFYTPQLTRVLPLQTNTVARPQAALFDGEMPKLNSFSGKPMRPRKTLDPSTSILQPLIQTAVDESPVQLPGEDVKIEEDENVRKERELRAQRRKSMLAAMDATPRHLADPSKRLSTVLVSASKRREGSIVPGSPSKRRLGDSYITSGNIQLEQSGDSSTAVSSQPALQTEATLVDLSEVNVGYSKTPITQLLLEEESDVSSAQDEVPEPSADALHVLKANVARARRESVVRAARLSHGGNFLASTETPLNTSDTEQEPGGESSQVLNLECLLSTGAGLLEPDNTFKDPSTERLDEGVEVDITEATAEVVEVPEDRPARREEPIKQEETSLGGDMPRTRRTVNRTPSPSKQAIAETSSTRTTRGTKRSATVEPEPSVVKRSTRRRVYEAQDDAESEIVVEEAPRPLRRGRSATPAAQSLEDTEQAAATPSTRSTRRAASETPQRTSRSPSKSRSTRGKVLAEPIIEEEQPEDDSPAVPEVEVPAKPSKIAKGKTGLPRPPSRNANDERHPLRATKSKLGGATDASTRSARPTGVTKVNSASGSSTRAAATVPRARPGSTATTSAIPPKRPAENGRPASESNGTRVKRSTRADQDKDDANTEDSLPRKRRKAADPVKEEDIDEMATPIAQVAPKKTASRLPSALPTTTRRTATATKATPSTRKAPVDHDKENTPETPQLEEQPIGKTSTSTAKRTAVSTRIKSAAPSNRNAVPTSTGRSLRERSKK
ncbi:hypothetical protein FRB90_010145 [Tulasnella sp. 427]|nr:hypothetical protein FRB90_010145 [Tulasnella sp. 427]